MSIESIIQNIEKLIADTSGPDPDRDAMARSSLNGIRASKGRACSAEPNSSASARMSVAVCAMSFVSSWIGRGEVPSATRRNLRELVSLSAMLAPIGHPGHEPASKPCLAPQGWSGRAGGPYSMKPGQGGLPSFTLTRRPHLPGGDWSVHVAGIPATFGTNSSEAARRAADLVRLLEDKPAARRPPPVNTRRSAAAATRSCY